MEKDLKATEIYNQFQDFTQSYNLEEKNEIWKAHSSLFRAFWRNTVLSKEIDEINDQEIDKIVRILDVHGKGNTKESEAVARVMIPQGAWRRMFNEIHRDDNLSRALTNIFENNDKEAYAGISLEF